MSRFFAPACGIAEDLVTGSAHCAPASYWAGRLGKESFRAHQASTRGGTLGVVLHGERMTLTGRAVTTLRGGLLLS